MCLWPTPGFPPVPIRWVRVVDPPGQRRAEAFFSTDRTWAPERIVEYYVRRRDLEVTFEEGRRHLGLETQRQGSDQAIVRTTPVLLALFSLVCLIAHRLTAGGKIRPQSASWYLKEEATFSDVLALIRRALWAEKYFNQSAVEREHVIFPRGDWEVLLNQLAATA